jgi:hypothetical protein
VTKPEARSIPIRGTDLFLLTTKFDSTKAIERTEDRGRIRNENNQERRRKETKERQINQSGNNKHKM